MKQEYTCTCVITDRHQILTTAYYRDRPDLVCTHRGYHNLPSFPTPEAFAAHISRPHDQVLFPEDLHSEDSSSASDVEGTVGGSIGPISADENLIDLISTNEDLAAGITSPMLDVEDSVDPIMGDEDLISEISTSTLGVQDSVIDPVVSRSRSSTKEHRCDDCGKIFSLGSNLKVHKQTVHLGHRNFECPHCSKLFTTKYSLQRHQLSHGDQRVTCDECGKDFRYLVHLNRHKLSHSGAVFNCDICDKVFQRKDVLKKHKKTHN